MRGRSRRQIEMMIYFGNGDDDDGCVAGKRCAALSTQARSAFKSHRPTFWLEIKTDPKKKEKKTKRKYIEIILEPQIEAGPARFIGKPNKLLL